MGGDASVSSKNKGAPTSKVSSTEANCSVTVPASSVRISMLTLSVSMMATMSSTAQYSPMPGKKERGKGEKRGKGAGKGSHTFCPFDKGSFGDGISHIRDIDSCSGKGSIRVGEKKIVPYCAGWWG